MSERSTQASDTTTTMPAVSGVDEAHVGRDGSSAGNGRLNGVDPSAATTVTPAAAGPADSGAAEAGTRSAGASAMGSSAAGVYSAAPVTPTAAVSHAAVQPVSTSPARTSPASPPPAAAAPTAKVPKRADRAPRRAKLQLRHLNVWSVLKFSCVLALALFLVWLIAIACLYGLLDHMHVFSKINETVQKINGDKVQQNYVSKNVVFGAALIIGLVNTVLFIVLSTIGSIVYNLCADLVGGIEVTLAERD